MEDGRTVAMTDLQRINLILHVLLGVVGVVASYAVWLALLKRTVNVVSARGWSLLAALSYVLSWLTGGYYYVTYYGSAVKPVIKAGAFPWAHTMFMEWKEHIFLFLPFLALVVFLALFFAGERVVGDQRLKRELATLGGVVSALGTIVALAGVVVSGAVR